MFGRIAAMLLRYKVLVFGSFPRLLSVFYWPSVQILLWGFFSNFLVNLGDSQFSEPLSFLLSSVILWDVLFRAQLGLSITFFEEIWSRNLGHLMISPIKVSELILSLILISFLRSCLGLFPAILVANYFFDFHLFELGFYLILFFLNLIFMGWSIGLIVSALVLRYGQSCEELAWAFIFILLPFSCVYYPIETLPEFGQLLAKLFPPVYIFEGMRELLINNNFSISLMIKSITLNIFYFLFSVFLFFKMINLSKIKGNFLNFGE